MERLRALYEQFVGSQPTEIVLMDKAGSNRQYYRLHGERSIVGVLISYFLSWLQSYIFS